MFEIHPASWPVAVDASDPRNQFHAHALREARVASDYRQAAPDAAPRRDVMTRVRLAFAGQAGVATTQPCNCPA